MGSNDVRVVFKGDDQLSKTIANIKDSMKQMGIASDDVLSRVVQKFDRAVNSTAPLKKRLRDIQSAMADMNAAGLDKSQASIYSMMAQEAGRLKDAISDAATATKQFSNDTMGLQAGIQAMQGLAGAGTVLTGVMGLLGTKSDAVTQAILKVQSAMAVLNGIQSIANVLNKDSALMLALKAAKMKLDTAATMENTVATSANTIAEGANTTAKVAETAATQAATKSQLALNVAVLANPYVIAAAAVAGLVAGIAVWISSMDDATDSELALEAATEAFDEAAGNQLKTAADQISTFNNLKRVYDENSNNVDVLTKKIINNKEAQRKLGVTVKTVDDVHRLFSKNAQNYIQSSIARANAMAAEAAQATLLGSVLAELSKVYSKMMKGEEVDWVDIRKEIQKIGVSAETATDIIKGAGGQQEWDWIYSNLKVDPDKLAQFARNLNEGVINAFYNTGAGKVLQEMMELSLKDFDVETADFSDLYEKNNKELKETSGHVSKIHSTSKETKEEIKKILTSLSGCDAIIRAAQDEMNNLDRASEGAAEKVKQLKATILTASVSKLNLLDDSSLEDLKQAQTLIRNIIDKLPVGADSIAKWSEKLKDVTNKITQREIELGVKVDPKETEIKKLENEFNNIKWKPEFSTFDIAIGQAKFDTSTLDGLERMIDFNDELIKQLKKITQGFEEQGETASDTYKAASEKLDELLAKNAELADSAQVKKMEEDAAEASKERFEGAIDSINQFGSALASLGDSLEMPELNVAGTLAQAIVTLIQSYSTALSQAASLGPFAWIAFAAAGLAQLTAVISSVKGLSKFAEGGIVGGGSTHGDPIIARLNAGEMVLNKRQQRNLFNMLDSNGVGNSGGAYNISWRIKGSDLYGTIKNYSKTQAKVGKTTGIR